MDNVKYQFLQDCHEKAITARSAKNRKRYPGKKGPVKLPSDYMSEAEMEALNGECKTYKLGAPMSWDEFSEMPDDLKTMYIKNLRKKFNVPDERLAVAMGTDIWTFAYCLKTVKLKPRHWGIDGCNWYDTDDHGCFNAWWIKEE